MQYGVYVVLFAYQVMLDISTGKRVAKNLPKNLYCEFRCNAIKKILDKISCRRRFKF